MQRSITFSTKEVHYIFVHHIVGSVRDETLRQAEEDSCTPLPAASTVPHMAVLFTSIPRLQQNTKTGRKRTAWQIELISSRNNGLKKDSLHDSHTLKLFL